QTSRGPGDIVAGWGGRELALPAHALAETYSVLTRLPGALRVDPLDAATLLRKRFVEPLTIKRATAARVADELSRLGIGGGAVCDALVALAAVENGVDLATRDLRAKPTYEAMGARVVIAA